MIHRCLVTEYLAEAPNIFTGEAGIHLTVFSKPAVHKIVFAFNTGDLETIGHQLHKHITCYILLRTLQKGFYIPHNRIEYLPFMQPVAVKISNSIFPA